MSLKEEIIKSEERERLEQIENNLSGLYQRIAVIVEYIDNLKENDGVTTITEEQLRQDEQHFREEGIRKAWELKNLELDQKIKDITKQLKEQENEGERINSAYDKGFEKGVNYTIGRVREMREASESLKKESQTASKEATEEVKEKDKIGLGLGKSIGDV